MINLELIKSQVGCNEAANLAQIKLCNHKLQKANLPEIPSAYAELLQQCNGFSNEDARVFGAEITDNNWYTDIFAYNQRFFDEENSSVLILGVDDERYFIYDTTDKEYRLIDQYTYEIVFSDTSFEGCLYRLLRIED